MAQPKQPTRRKPTARRAAPAKQVPENLVIITRERLQELFDDAVRRGRMTRDDATELVTEMMRRSRAGDLLADVEQLLGRSRDQLEDVGRRARRVVGIVPAFPIDGYDDLTAAQIQSKLGTLTPAELRKVRDYERRNANRKTVLEAVEQKLT